MSILENFIDFDEKIHGHGISELAFPRQEQKISSLSEAMLAVGFREHEITYINNYAGSSNTDTRQACKDLGIGTQDKMTAAIALYRNMAWLSSIKAKYLNPEPYKNYAVGSPQDDEVILGVPIGKSGNKIVYAISQYEAINEIKMNLRGNGIGSENAIFALTLDSVVNMLYRRGIFNSLEDLVNEIKKNNTNNVRPLMDKILVHAAYSRASDIHFTALEKGGLIEFRIDGVKNFIATLNQTIYNSLIIVLANSLGKPDFVMKVEGRIKENTIPAALKNRFEFRVEIMKEVFGTDMTIRLFDLGSETNDIESLGFIPEDLKTLKKYADSGSGMVIFVGPTGSGKTTTSYASMKTIDATRRSVQTVENPAENKVGMWRQYQLLHVENKTEHEEWEDWNKGLLRNDPDVVLQGEIRDGKLLNVALDMAVTGHLVYCTLHADDSAKAVLRMKQMRSADGSPIDIDLLASIIQGIIAQRLLRKLCDSCKVKSYDEDLITYLNEFKIGHEAEKLYRAHESGCDKCSYTGYRGRMLVYEILNFNNALIDEINDHDTNYRRIYAHIPPKETLLGKSLRYAADGLTDFEEISRNLKR